MRYRILSHGNIDEYEQFNENYVKNAPDKPIHKPIKSLFSSSSGFTNFRGIFNWALLLLVITTARLALENVLTHGIVMDPFAWARFILTSENRFMALGLLICANIFIVIGWLIQYALANQLLANERLATLLTCVNLTAVLVFPTVAILKSNFIPFFSSPALLIYTIVFLKLWSYAHVNYWCRQGPRAQSPSSQFHQTRHESSSETGDSGVAHTESDDVFTSDPCHDNDRQRQDDLDNHHEDNGDMTQLKFNSQPATPVELAEVHRRSIAWSSSASSLERRISTSGSSKNGNDGEESSLRRRTARHSVATSHMHDRSNRHESTLEVDPLLFHQNLGAFDDIWSQQLHYPDNITLGNLYYFMLAPTLCYELNFPRTLAIDKVNLCHRMIELIFIPQLAFCLIQQWIVPILAKSSLTLYNSGLAFFVERCLKLVVPNHLLWLLMFYWMFHSLCNVMAELLQFADRYFYSDWWNAETIQAFWSKWNLPVHRFARRHIYLPLLESGWKRSTAGMLVFFISALLHEFLVSVPLKMAKLWAFAGMIFQLPLSWLTKAFFPKHGPWGNVSLWITLILGQPLGILAYYHDYYVMRHPISTGGNATIVSGN